MNHIYKLSEFGENWFDYQELYSLMVKEFPSGSKFVEVGSWKGKSAAYIAVEIINSKKDIKIDCIDLWVDCKNSWKGISEDQKHEDIKSNHLYELFIKNISSLSNIINPIRMDSISASKIYKDNTIDFVFIDANHDHDNVKKDIEAWFPKVKTGGIIAGHDYTKYWPGLIKAVNDFFGEKNILKSGSCWVYDK
jgi:cephalosporin hydroxylase